MFGPFFQNSCAGVAYPTHFYRFLDIISLSSCVWALFSEFRRSLSNTFLSILGYNFALVVCLGAFFSAFLRRRSLSDTLRHFSSFLRSGRLPVSSNLCLQRPTPFFRHHFIQPVPSTSILAIFMRREGGQIKTSFWLPMSKLK